MAPILFSILVFSNDIHVAYIVYHFQYVCLKGLHHLWLTAIGGKPPGAPLLNGWS